jgi:hypothetical protein
MYYLTEGGVANTGAQLLAQDMAFNVGRRVVDLINKAVDSGSCAYVSTKGHPLLDRSNALIVRSFEEGLVKK